MRNQFVSLAAAAIMCSAAACASYETKNVINNPRPDPARPAQTERQRMEGELVAGARASGNVVKVLVTKPVLCRDLTTTPMIADVTDEKALTSEGRGAQYLLGGGAVVLAALGGYYLASPCTKTESGAGGQELEVRCTSDEASKQKGTGVGLLVLGGAAGGMFAVNVARTQDESAVRSVQAARTESPWQECDSEPMEGIKVHLVYRGHGWAALTDDRGRATFDMTTEQPQRGMERDPVARIRVDGRDLAEVDLSSLDVYQDWRHKLVAAEMEREELQLAAQARSAAEAEARQARLKEAAEKCQAGDSQTCYSIGLDIGGARGAEWLRKSCELSYQAGCIAYQEYLERQRQAEARQRLARLAASAKAGRDSSSAPKRSLDNPDDVRLLQALTRDFGQCEIQCARDVQECIRGLSGEIFFDDAGRQISKARKVAVECNPTYQACQSRCEQALNREGFCLAKNVHTGKATGAVGPCP